MRLIDVDAFKADYRMADECKDCKTNVRACEYDRVYTKMEFCSWLDDAPTVAPERKRGKWIAVTEDGDVYKRICSCCGREAFFQNDDPDELYDGGRYELSDFCPNCGADMRGEQDE